MSKKTSVEVFFLYNTCYCLARLSFSQLSCCSSKSSARVSSSLPGDIRCQVEAPEGCGKGIISTSTPLIFLSNFSPMTSTSLFTARYCDMASLPTGIISLGRNRSISVFSHCEQVLISALSGTRSPPFGFFPGKQRHTADIYTCSLNLLSRTPIESNHLNSVLPAVQANGRPSSPSLSPGACPTSNISEKTGAPRITGGIIFGHNRQAPSRDWCERINSTLFTTHPAYTIYLRKYYKITTLKLTSLPKTSPA